MSHRHSNGPKEGQMSGGVVEDCLWCSNGGDPTADTPAGRIRELEAELAKERTEPCGCIANGEACKRHRTTLEARAEKAEHMENVEREAKVHLQARVAELEDWIRGAFEDEEAYKRILLSGRKAREREAE